MDEINKKIIELEEVRNSIGKEIKRAQEKQKELDNIIVKLKSLSTEKDGGKKSAIVEEIAVGNTAEKKTIEDRLSSGIKKVVKRNMSMVELHGEDISFERSPISNISTSLIF